MPRISAVNEGQIFRFSDQALPARSPSRCHRRRRQPITGCCAPKRVLLQETLIGCIKALVDVLAITNPVAFGRATRVKRLASDLASSIGKKGSGSSTPRPCCPKLGISLCQPNWSKSSTTAIA